MPPAESAGEYLHLVINVQSDPGNCTLRIESAAGQERIALSPATLVIRLWRSTPTGILRGNISLHGTDSVAPIQTNARMEQLIRTWLFEHPSPQGDGT